MKKVMNINIGSVIWVIMSDKRENIVLFLLKIYYIKNFILLIYFESCLLMILVFGENNVKENNFGYILLLFVKKILNKCL